MATGKIEAPEGAIYSTQVALAATDITWTDGYLYLMRCGRVVQGVIKGNLTVASGKKNTYITLCDIPLGYRPKYERTTMYGCGYNGNTKQGDIRFTTINYPYRLYFNADFDGVATTASFFLTWITEDPEPTS